MGTLRQLKVTLKSAIKQTPLWPLLRPRRVLVYGIGAPRTGTKSIANIFSESYRSAHEPHLEETLDLLNKKLTERAPSTEIRQALIDRDRMWRLECEANAALTYFTAELAPLFPEARFICTIRHPKPWLRSMINKRITGPAENLSSTHQRARNWRRSLYDALPSSSFPPEEQALAEYSDKYGVRNIDSYLSGWCDQYKRIFRTLPEKRYLLLRTDAISESIHRIAQFVGVPSSTLCKRESHLNRTSEYHNVFSELDDAYLETKIKTRCQDVISFAEKQLGCSLR